MDGVDGVGMVGSCVVVRRVEKVESGRIVWWLGSGGFWVVGGGW